MTMTIIRPNQHVYTLPGYGQHIIEAEASVAAANWWEVAGKTCVAAYQPKGAASYAASLVNLANPGTYDASEGVAPDWAAATGWTFNGTDDYLATVALNQAATFAIALDAASRRVFGVYNTGPTLNQNGWHYLWSPGDYEWDDFASPVVISNRIVYYNGVLRGTLGAFPADQRPFLLGSSSSYAVHVEHGSCVIKAFAAYAEALDAGEAAALSAAMAAI